MALNEFLLDCGWRMEETLFLNTVQVEHLLFEVCWKIDEGSGCWCVPVVRTIRIGPRKLNLKLRINEDLLILNWLYLNVFKLVFNTASHLGFYFFAEDETFCVLFTSTLEDILTLCKCLRIFSEYCINPNKYFSCKSLFNLFYFHLTHTSKTTAVLNDSFHTPMLTADL